MKKKGIINLENTKIIAIALFIVVAFSLLFLLFHKNNNNKENDISNSSWTDNIESMDFIKINDFSNNSCGISYYSPIFKIENGILKDYSNEIICEGMFSLLSINYGKCDTNILFVTSMYGELYYLSNIKTEGSQKYELIKIPDVEYIKTIVYDSSGKLYAIDINENDTDISDSINDVIGIDLKK